MLKQALNGENHEGWSFILTLDETEERRAALTCSIMAVWRTLRSVAETASCVQDGFTLFKMLRQACCTKPSDLSCHQKMPNIAVEFAFVMKGYMIPKVWTLIREIWRQLRSVLLTNRQINTLVSAFQHVWAVFDHFGLPYLNIIWFCVAFEMPNCDQSHFSDGDFSRLATYLSG